MKYCTVGPWRTRGKIRVRTVTPPPTSEALDRWYQERPEAVTQRETRDPNEPREILCP